MEIITKLPRYSDGEVDRAFMKEIQTGFRMEAVQAEDRDKKARKEANKLRGKTHPTLGKCVAVMHPRDFFRLTNKYGHKEVHSKEFLKYFNKKHKDLSPNNA
jgi:hypothetical protein